METKPDTASVRNGILQAVGILAVVVLLGWCAWTGWNSVGAESRAARAKEAEWLAERDAQIYGREIAKLRGN